MEPMKTMLFTLWVSSGCNLSCKYCYEGEEKKHQQMTIATANAALTFMHTMLKQSNSKSLRIVFHGGEPLLNFPLIQYVIKQSNDILNGYHIEYSITTNATLLNQESIDFLAEHIADITVSLDGTKYYHDLNRRDKVGNGSFELALANALLLQRKQDIRIRMTVTPNNVCNLFTNVQFLIHCGFHTIIPAIDYFDNSWNDELLENLQNQLLLIKKHLASANSNNVFIAMIDKIELRKVGPCRGGIDNFHISPDGFLYPCVYTVANSKYRCGSVFEGVDTNKQHEFLMINSQMLSECEGCTYYEGCLSSRCKFLNDSIMGDYYKPSPLICSEQHIRLSLYYS